MAEGGPLLPSDDAAESRTCPRTDAVSPSRLSTLHVACVTAVITCIVTLAGTFALWSAVSRRAPSTPRLPPPKTITVTIYPYEPWMKTGYPPTEIPAGKLDYARRLVTPDKYYEGGVNDMFTPLMAVVVLTHEGQPDTRLLVRHSGHNPALISVDGRNYFYGRNEEDIHDGGLDLLRLVRQVTDAKQR